MVLVLLAGGLALRGFHKDVPRAYNATEVTRSAQAWTGPRRDASKQQQHARHDAARAACAKHDSSVVRANTDAKSFQETGGWCLPEGRNASSRVALPHGQSYDLPRVHALPDFIMLRFLDRLLRACDPAGDSVCTSPPHLSVLDFGAGVGQYGHSLLAMEPRHRYSGYDGAGNVEGVTARFVSWADLTSPTLSLHKADWVLSLAVGEHVPNPLEKDFVRNLDAHNCCGILLCWGYLREWGRGHVNNHGNLYMQTLFEELGYTLDEKASLALRTQHHPSQAARQRARWEAEAARLAAGGPYWWFSKGVYLLRRRQPDTGPGCRAARCALAEEPVP